VKPPLFDPTDPASPSYGWTSFDQLIIRATSRGLAPILSIVRPPTWATVAPEPGAEKTLPDPAELGAFALAAARRYSGVFNGLPRVRYWQVWNEPNISLFFRPQFLNGQPFSPGWYRRMVNEVAQAVCLRLDGVAAPADRHLDRGLRDTRRRSCSRVSGWLPRSV